jgi:hypothetical protein
MASSMRKVERAIAHYLGLAPPGWTPEELDEHERPFVDNFIQRAEADGGPEGIELSESHIWVMKQSFEPVLYDDNGVRPDSVAQAVAVELGELPEAFQPGDMSILEEREAQKTVAHLRVRVRLTKLLAAQGVAGDMARLVEEAADQAAAAMLKSGECNQCEKKPHCETREALLERQREIEALPTQGNA